MSHPDALEALRERARRVRARALVRRWEYRQRRHAKGAWRRLSRVFAEAARAWSVPQPVAEALVAEGHRPEPVGAELEPPKTLLFVPPERITAISERSPLPLRLGPETLAARWVVLERL